MVVWLDWFVFEVSIYAEGLTLKSDDRFTSPIERRLIYSPMFIASAVSSIGNGVIIVDNKKPPRLFYERFQTLEPNPKSHTMNIDEYE